MICKNCGAEIGAGHIACPKCGSLVEFDTNKSYGIDWGASAESAAIPEPTAIPEPAVMPEPVPMPESVITEVVSKSIEKLETKEPVVLESVVSEPLKVETTEPEEVVEKEFNESDIQVDPEIKAKIADYKISPSLEIEMSENTDSVVKVDFPKREKPPVNLTDISKKYTQGEKPKKKRSIGKTIAIVFLVITVLNVIGFLVGAYLPKIGKNKLIEVKSPDKAPTEIASSDRLYVYDRYLFNGKGEYREYTTEETFRSPYKLNGDNSRAVVVKEVGNSSDSYYDFIFIDKDLQEEYFEAHAGYFHKFDNQGRVYYYTTDDTNIYRYDPATKQKDILSTDATTYFCVSPNGRYVAVFKREYGDESYVERIGEDGSVVKMYTSDSYIEPLSISDDGNYLLCKEGPEKIIYVKFGEEPKDMGKIENYVTYRCCTTDGSGCIWCDGNEKHYYYDAALYAKGENPIFIGEYDSYDFDIYQDGDGLICIYEDFENGQLNQIKVNGEDGCQTTLIAEGAREYLLDEVDSVIYYRSKDNEVMRWDGDNSTKLAENVWDIGWDSTNQVLLYEQSDKLYQWSESNKKSSVIAEGVGRLESSEDGCSYSNIGEYNTLNIIVGNGYFSVKDK